MATTTAIYVREPFRFPVVNAREIGGTFVSIGTGAALHFDTSAAALALADACQEAARLLRRAEVERANTQVPA